MRHRNDGQRNFGDTELGDHPEEAQRGDQQVDARASALPVAARRERDGLEQNFDLNLRGKNLEKVILNVFLIEKLIRRNL